MTCWELRSICLKGPKDFRQIHHLWFSQSSFKSKSNVRRANIVRSQEQSVRVLEEIVKAFRQTIYRASDISRGRGPAKFRYFREIPRNSQKNAKYREICQKYFQIHVGKTYLILILVTRPVLFTPNVYLPTLTPAGWKLRSHAGSCLQANFSRLIEKCELLPSCLTQFPKIC